MEPLQHTEAVSLTLGLVAGYVSNNSVTADALPGLITSVHATIAGLGAPAAPVAAAKPTPAVNPRKSVTDEAIISLIDGRPYKSLKRHIGVHGYTPHSYRDAFGLAADYPMVAKEYSKKRSSIAKEIGLGKSEITGDA